MKLFITGLYWTKTVYRIMKSLRAVVAYFTCASSNKYPYHRTIIQENKEKWKKFREFKKIMADVYRGKY